MQKIKNIYQKIMVFILISIINPIYAALGNLGALTGTSGTTINPKTFMEQLATDYGPIAIGVVGLIVLVGVGYRVYNKWDEAQKKEDLSIFLSSLFTSIIVIVLVGFLLWGADLLLP